MSDNELIQVGKIIKSKRLKGAVICTFEPFFISDEFSPIVLFIGTTNPLPYFVSELEIIDEHKCSILFEDVESKEAARKLSGKTIQVRSSDMDVLGLVTSDSFEDIYPFHDYKVNDKTAGFLGRITAIYEAHGNIVADCTVKDKSTMIPLHPDLIAEIDHENKTIYTDFPRGLTDL